jgi:hypothetical protein
MSTAFASRLAQFIGLPTSNKHDQEKSNDDSWYTPYTGPYEPPPSQLRASMSSTPLDTSPEPGNEDSFAAYPHPYSYQIPHRAYRGDEGTEREPGTSKHRSVESKRYGTGQARRGSGPSILSGASGIGESPVAPHVQAAKAERAGLRPSFASFMNFGGRRASHTPQTHRPPLNLTIPPHPASAQPATSTFPETMLPSPEQYYADNFPQASSASASGYHTPPLMRKRTLTHSGFLTAPRSNSSPARAFSQVNEPSRSFFDASVLTKADSPLPSPALVPTPAPIERTPSTPAYSHPFAAAYLGPRQAPPVRPSPKPGPLRKKLRPTTSPGDRARERDRKGKGKERAVPGLGLGLGIQSPAPEVRHAIKASVSTPNLREAFHHVSSREQDEEAHYQPQDQQQQQQQTGHPVTGTSAGTGGGGAGVGGARVLAGQTLCDTLFFPRPRLQAHTITPPLTPENNTQTWSHPQSNSNSGPPMPTIRHRANSLRWLRRKPSAPELRPSLPPRTDSRTELERVIAEGKG